MFNRENAIGLVLLLFCAVVAIVLLYGITTGSRFHFDGPSWVGTALAILFIGATAWGFFTRPGRRWPWERWMNKDSDDRSRDI